jgi:mRNA interferase HigB
LERRAGLRNITNCYNIGPVKLISNRALRDFASLYPDADAPLQAFRVRVEKGVYRNFAELRATFRGVDKVGARYVFNIGGNKYRVVAGIAFSVQMLWVKSVLTHAQYDEGDWK